MLPEPEGTPKSMLTPRLEVKATVGDIQVCDRFGDCVLHRPKGIHFDHLVSGVEADAVKLDAETLFSELVGEGVPPEDADRIVQSCW